MYYPMVLNSSLSQENLFFHLELQGYEKEDLCLLLPNCSNEDEIEITKIDVLDFPLVFTIYGNRFQCSSLVEFASIYLSEEQLDGELYLLTYKNTLAIISLPENSWYNIKPVKIFLGHFFQGNIYLEYFSDQFPEETLKKLEVELCYLQQNFAYKTA